MKDHFFLNFMKNKSCCTEILKIDIRIGLCVAFALLYLLIGCASPQQDPLASWQIDLKEQPHQAVVDDYKKYIAELSPQEKQSANVIDWRKDGTGMHAVVILIPLDRSWWKHIITYDINDRRVKVIKIFAGKYRS